jgi:hypothetical protein
MHKICESPSPEDLIMWRMDFALYDSKVKINRVITPLVTELETPKAHEGE